VRGDRFPSAAFNSRFKRKQRRDLIVRDLRKILVALPHRFEQFGRFQADVPAQVVGPDTNGGFLMAYDPATGTERWRVPGGSAIGGGTVATGGGIVLQAKFIRRDFAENSRPSVAPVEGR
jgi:hypothetical protein